MSNFFKEFKEFAVKGNVIDLAVGVIIGTAFGKIVSSLVTDIIMPPVGVLLGGIDFSKLTVVLKPATDNTLASTINYGLFINNIIDFLIVAFVIFVVVKQINRLKRKEVKKEAKEEVKVEAASEEVLLLRQIRDQLKRSK